MNHLKRLALTIAIASITFPSWSCAAPSHLSTKEQNVLHNISIDSNGEVEHTTLAKAMDFYNVPAISFAVINNNEITWVDSIGYIDADHRQKVDNDTLFQAGSMSKSVAAITALSLVEHGFLTLDENALPLLKGWSLRKTTQFKHAQVTLRELLSMSSGLNVGGYYGYEPNQKLPSLIQTLNGAKPANNQPVQMVYKPGSQYSYSGGGYEVVQLLSASQTGLSAQQSGDKFVFKPLDMQHTFYEQPLSKTHAKNAAYATDEQGKNFPFRWRISPERAAAGLWTTPTDLAKFVLSVMHAYQGKTGQVISHKLALEALTKQTHTPYGLGFVIEDKGNTLHFMKLGQNSGYQGWLVGLPNTGQGMVVMTNSDNGRELAQDLIEAVAKAYQWPITGKLKDAWMVS